MKKRVKTELAPLWKRFVAFGIDLAVLFVIVLIPFSGVITASAPSDPFGEGDGVFFVGILLCFMMYAYTIMLENKYGQTVGKMIVGIRIHHPQLQTRHVLIRNSYYLLLALLGPLVIIDTVGMFVSSQKQRVLDMLAGTTVVVNG